MNRCKTQLARLFAIDQQIQSGKFPNCLTFAEEWGVSKKTVQRDINYLRDQLAAPIEYSKLKEGYYYSEKNWFLPSLSLSEGEILAVLLGSRVLEQFRGLPVAVELERVFRKFEDMLPDKLDINPELLFTRFSLSSQPSKPVDPDIWKSLIRSLLQQRSLKICYRKIEATKSTVRIIEPYHVANLHGEWYVFALCHKRETIRQFAIPRISKAKVLNSHFDLPDEFNPQALLASAFGRYANPDEAHDVILQFDKDVVPWVIERQWHPNQKIITRKDGSVELCFKTESLHEVFRWVLSWGHDVTVVAPDILRTWLDDEIRMMANKIIKNI